MTAEERLAARDQVVGAFMRRAGEIDVRYNIAFEYAVAVVCAANPGMAEKLMAVLERRPCDEG